MSYSQSRRLSLLEVTLSVGSGFLLAMALWQYVVPLFYPHLEPTLGENIWITTLFTSASLLRSYLWRRLFNGNFPKAALKFIRSL